VHARFVAADPHVRSELVHTGRRAPEDLVTQAQRHGVRLRSFVDYQGLIDLGPLADRQAARLASDRIYPAELYVAQRYRVITGDAAGPVEDDLHEQVTTWLSAQAARLVMVLGDFGRGKTSLLRHLARTLPGSLPGLLPVLVELRSLEKAPSLDELLGQHLIRQQVDDISPGKLRYMIRSGRLALLLDGFDELELRVGYDNAADYLRTLLESVTDRAKVVLTSRTQHFRSTAQVRTALGERVAALAGSRVVVLEDFTPGQILEFLTKLYAGDTAAARARLALLGEIEDLLGLARNPRMLAFIAKLDEDRLRAVQRREGRISAAELYRELVDFWLVGEADRQRHRHGLRSLDERERLAACVALARRLWAATQLSIPMSDLSAEVSATLTRLAERGYSVEQATQAIGSGSLLVRTEDATFTFVHQSIMEWLVADAAAQALLHSGRCEELGARLMSALMVDFFCDLAGWEPARGWAASVLGDPQASAAAKQNALAVSTRITETGAAAGWGPRPDLAGVDLRGQDLTGRDLQGADLQGADLRGMRLRGVDLTGADLRDADLTGVRMTGGSLRDARLDGSRWDRAALLGVAGADAPAGSTGLRRAANPAWDAASWQVAPGGPATCVAFSPDGTLMAIGRYAAVEIVDRADDRTVRVLQGHTGRVSGVAFSPDGTLLATASGDTTARLWQVATGQHHTTLQGHTSAVYGVAFSPDGTLLATASDDNTARLWQVATGACLAVLLPLPGGCAVLLPDGSYKLDGEPGDALWWALKLCRFAPGELDQHVPGLTRRPVDFPICEAPLPRRLPAEADSVRVLNQP
ncbi:MAG TPA: pentapeptide repeat-containing protein, partial [Micromonosporaceae bacterium]|nr:pentapeptide repeat-containing protein [Micromonosporaceae bacterium]